MLHLYGIPNCDTVKKAMSWLKKNQVEIIFHDFKKEPPTAPQLKGWAKSVGMDKLFNKNSTTWKELPPEEQESARDAKGAIALMQKHTSIIKRPVVEWPNGAVTAGFKEAVYLDLIS